VVAFFSKIKSHLTTKAQSEKKKTLKSTKANTFQYFLLVLFFVLSEQRSVFVVAFVSKIKSHLTTKARSKRRKP